ncbi:MAG: DUF1553 domain-containing protein [Planctomycetaceae bacterium]|nr:DUF1553 domain-containing protein [Planctomycetaceae bacterium]
MKRLQLSWYITALCLLYCGRVLFAVEPEESASVLTYEEHIRPIFRKHCFDCHGATETPEGGLDLRLVRFLLKGGDTGPAVVENDADNSLLLQRIRKGEMPPGEKKLSESEAAVLEQWIQQGAATARQEPESLPPGLGITPEERAFWSFQPIRRPAVPGVQDLPAGAVVRTPIDALLIQHAAAQQRSADPLRELSGTSTLAPPADRRTLIVRAWFRLQGLPPSPEELQRWMSADGEDWFDRLLTELMDSPHYGEHWGRHWLDVAGYADSEGFTVADAERPWAWKYRDWVIRAIQQDKPFDRFLTEQLAGDELAGPQNGDLTAEQIELLTATGFLRMAADGTGSGADTPEGRNQVMADTLKIVGTSLLGLSLQCAQCHDHRYDPIPQSDYYALRAVFEPALDWQAWKSPQQRLVSLYTAADRQRAAEVEQEAQAIAAERGQKQQQYLDQALEKVLAMFEEPLKSELRQAKQTADGERTEVQKQLLAANPSVNISPGVLYQYLPDAAEDLKKYDQRIAEVRSKKPAEQFLRALVEPVGHVPETKLFHRGDHQQPKQSVMPASLTVTEPEHQVVTFAADDESVPTSGRRLAFARWLTSDRQPLFARVIVNRVWLHHFGRGLVATPADFGKLGAAPTHPELLDWLAAEFTTHGWSLKYLHRLIMTSAVWQQSQVAPDAAEKTTTTDGSAAAQAVSDSTVVPDVYPLHLVRLNAESIRDRMLAVSGSLDRTPFGPPVAIKEDDTGQIIEDGKPTRRSIYLQIRRSKPVAMLQAFDAPVMETNCECRSVSTVATQSLMLLNSRFVLDQAAAFADRIAAEPVELPADFTDRLAPLPKLPAEQWSYGYGTFDEEQRQTASFLPLTHWTGSQWQAGPTLPDAEQGWVLLHAAGGHPDVPQRAVIRRWTVPADGTVSISGMLSHPSENGDGVCGRVVHSGFENGCRGQWIVQHSSADTTVAEFAVGAGQTIDFITDCRENQTSDSFNWPVTLAWKPNSGSPRTIVSTEQFGGPAESKDALPGQVYRAWQLAFSRDPVPEELNLCLSFLSEQLQMLSEHAGAVPENRGTVRQALTNLCQSFLTSNEFLYSE